MWWTTIGKVITMEIVGIKHLAYDSSKGACYYVSKYYDRNVDNDIFVLWLNKIHQ